MSDMSCILASQSMARQHMLKQAGVPFSAKPAFVDEEALKEALQFKKQSPRNIADALAEAKALKLSLSHPGALVIGGDQVLEFGGEIMSKARNMEELRQKLEQLSGQSHILISAVCLAQNGQILWRFIDRARLAMRALSPDFLNDYIVEQGEKVLSSVGGYHIEGCGAQLFDKLDGDYFTILGMPLLPLLSQLRLYGVLKK